MKREPLLIIMGVVAVVMTGAIVWIGAAAGMETGEVLGVLAAVAGLLGLGTGVARSQVWAPESAHEVAVGERTGPDGVFRSRS